MAVVASADFEPIVSRSAVDDATHDALRIFVGRGRRYSVKQLARGTGVPQRMIEAAIAPVGDTEFRPLSRDHFWSIMRFLRAPFANEVMAKLAHMGAFDLPDDELPAPGEIVAESAEDHAALARAASDGEFCELDHANLRVVGEEHIERGMQLVSISRRGRRARAA